MWGSFMSQPGSDTHYLSYFTGWNSVIRPHPQKERLGSLEEEESIDSGQYLIISVTGKQVLSIVGKYVEASNQRGGRHPWKTS